MWDLAPLRRIENRDAGFHRHEDRSQHQTANPRHGLLVRMMQRRHTPPPPAVVAKPDQYRSDYQRKAKPQNHRQSDCVHGRLKIPRQHLFRGCAELRSFNLTLATFTAQHNKRSRLFRLRTPDFAYHSKKGLALIIAEISGLKTQTWAKPPTSRFFVGSQISNGTRGNS